LAKGLELRNFLWETKLSLALPTRTRLYKKGRRKAVKRGGAVSIGHIGGQMTKSHATLREFFNDAISFVFGPRRDEQDIMDELWNSGMRPSFFMPTATAEFSTADGVSHCEEIEGVFPSVIRRGVYRTADVVAGDGDIPTRHDDSSFVRTYRHVNTRKTGTYTLVFHEVLNDRP
jgi:hypothetical protein